MENTPSLKLVTSHYELVSAVLMHCLRQDWLSAEATHAGLLVWPESLKLPACSCHHLLLKLLLSAAVDATLPPRAVLQMRHQISLFAQLCAASFLKHLLFQLITALVLRIAIINNKITPLASNLAVCDVATSGCQQPCWSWCSFCLTVLKAWGRTAHCSTVCYL